MITRSSHHPSPSLLVAVIALVVALTGGAIAGAGSASKPVTKKVVKKVANKQISKRAPGLSVASAKSAETAKAAEDARSLQGIGPDGFVRYGSTIPSGVTVTGVFGTSSITPAATGALAIDDVSFPAPAPAPVGETDVNFAADTAPETSDDDASCTGTSANPTAPAGKVCLYTLQLGGGGSFYGQGAGGTAGRLGFKVEGVNPAGGTLYLEGSWAYTAP